MAPTIERNHIMRRIAAAAAVAALGTAMLAAPAQARSEGPRAAAKVAQSAPWGERSLLNINNMSLWFKRDGFSARNPLNDNSGVTFPRSTDQIVFQDGMIWGGIVNDGEPQTLRVGGQTYEIGTVPGAIVSKGVAEDASDPSVRIYRIRRDFRTADLRLDASELFGKGLSEVTDADVAELRAQYEADWREWPADKGAPFYDNNGDGVYSPAYDASGNPILDGTADEPGVANADQVAWYVINDLDVGAATSLYGSKPIGLEVQVTLWGYARTDALGDVIFKKYQIVYEGTATTPDDATISDMYFAQWADPDVGDYGDDFAGSDIGLSLGYAYNGQESDSHYDGFGLAPPAVGYDFLQGPAVPVYLHDADGNILTDEETGEPLLDMNAEAIWNFGSRPGYKNLPMTSFVYFAAGSAIDDPELGEYVGTEEWYNLLRGFQPQPDIDNPVPYTNALTGEETKFTLDGDPTRAQGWNDGIPLPAGDRRIVLNTGPFEMALGDTQEVVVALLGAVGTSRLRSVAKLKFTDQFVQDAYNSAFQVPSPPTAPNVRTAQLDQSLVLDWGWDPTAVIDTEMEGSPGFEFEGYNIYQLPSAEATLSQGVRVATYDMENGVTTILGIDLDEQSGIVLDVPQQIGTDFGVKRNITITQDYIRGGPLVNGQEYYFAVTAYNRATGAAAAVTTLESSPQLLIVKPQLAPPGTRYEAQPALQINAGHASGASDGSVVASVVDPTQTTGDTYEVRFDADADGNTIWNLVNVTDGVTLLTGETDQTGAANYIGADGFEIAVSGPPNGMKSWAAPAESFDEWAAGNGGGTVADYVEANDHSSATRWFTWAGGSGDWGAEGFSGAMTGDPNNQWFAPTTVTPDRLRTVELRFTSVNETPGKDQYRPLDLTNENVSYAYRYLRGAGADPPALADMTVENPWDFSPYILNTEGPGVYVYQDRVPVALAAYDIEADPPRRLEVAFLENNQPGGMVNGVYGPPFYGDASNVASSGPREWLFIFDLDYTDPNAGENSDILLTNGLIPDASAGEDNLPFMWIIFSERRVVDRFPMDGDRFILVANHVNTADDVFSFTVPGVDSSELLLKEDVKKVNVFPNPYYGVNEAETNRYNSFITFSHLPQRATIRIFDLSGTLVRVMEKDSADQFQRWDLANDNGLPVASGLYIAHVEMPDVGATKTLKLAVVAEEQFLENY
jgi:hypothetical protein